MHQLLLIKSYKVNEAASRCAASTGCFLRSRLKEPKMGAPCGEQSVEQSGEQSRIDMAIVATWNSDVQEDMQRLACTCAAEVPSLPSAPRSMPQGLPESSALLWRGSHHRQACIV
jgi:hypothetical protein